MLALDKTMLTPTGEPSPELLRALLEAHGKTRARLYQLREMYLRHHNIERRTRLKGLPNNRLSHDLPGYIVTMAAGYLVGSPINYTPGPEDREAFAPIANALKAAISDNVDAELAVDAAVYGKGVEICYADSEARPRIAQVSPLSAFVVYDDTVEHTPLFGVMLRKPQGPDLQTRREVLRTANQDEVLLRNPVLG